MSAGAVDLDGLSALVVQTISARGGFWRRGELWFLCPSHPDKRESAAFRPDTNEWYCQGCGAGGLVVSLARALGVRVDGKIDEETAARMEANRVSVMAADAEKRARESETLSDYWRKAGLAAELRRHADAMARLVGEGISRQAMDHFGIGWSVYGVDGVGVPALAIPWMVRGEARAVQFRLLSDDAPGGRYRWKIGSRPTLYNADAVITPCDDRIIVVEGAKKAMALWSAGVESVCAVTNKAGWKVEYARPFERFASVVFALDPDATVEAEAAALTVPRARVAYLPMKPDDLLTATGGDIDMFMGLIDSARRGYGR